MSAKLKEYLKTDIQNALGFKIDSVEFDRIMGAFASAIDRYLKTDIEIDTNIESLGEVTLPTETIDNTNNIIQVETKTVTKGRLV